MLYYDRINVSEGIDVNLTSASEKCSICCYWYFLDKGLRFQNTIFYGCQEWLIMSSDIKSITVLNINGVDYYWIIFGISKSEDIDVLKNADLIE